MRRETGFTGKVAGDTRTNYNKTVSQVQTRPHTAARSPSPEDIRGWSADTARSSCPEFLTHTKAHRPTSSQLYKTRVPSCSEMGELESMCSLTGQLAPLHHREHHPPHHQPSITVNRRILSRQHVTPKPPAVPREDLGCSKVLFQVQTEVSCSNDLLSKVESMRIRVKTTKDRRASISKDRRASICRSRPLAKAEHVPAESIAAPLSRLPFEPLPTEAEPATSPCHSPRERLTAKAAVEGILVETPPSPEIRYLPGFGFSAIRRMQAVRLRNHSDGSARAPSTGGASRDPAEKMRNQRRPWASERAGGHARVPAPPYGGGHGRTDGGGEKVR
jgi:hypothetical protein